MPWLAATAFIHSGLVQQRRGMLQAWNFVLVISAFALTILGTFLTRSGTINSVHSFTQSAIGPALLGFLVLVLVGSFTLFAMRSHIVASSPRIESFVSREGTFLVNNLLLTVYAFVVLIGTTYPLLLEGFTGTQVGVGEPFFNRLAIPLSFMLLLTMGFGPVTPWRGAAPGLLWSRLRGPTLIALGVGLLLAVTVTRVGWVILAIVLGTFVVAAIVFLLFELARNRAEKSGRRLLTEARTVIGNDQPFWAGQVSHTGVVLVAIGIAFASNLPLHAEAELAPGESVDFAGYTITYDSPFRREEPNRVVEGARVEVHRSGELVSTLEPRANFYGGVTGGIITPAVMARPGGDLYLTLRNLDANGVELSLDTSPMIWLLWLGGLTTAAGGFWSLSARRRERAIEPEPVAANV
jgi:cytochrome c-type biogenesis protein CcmF